MDFGPLRTLSLSVNLRAPGSVAAVVTRPAPDNTPITTRAIWVRPVEDQQPYGSDIRRAAPRRVAVLSKADVPTVPRGTLIAAAEVTGGAALTWRVDGHEQAAQSDHWAVNVMQVQA